MLVVLKVVLICSTFYFVSSSKYSIEHGSQALNSLQRLLNFFESDAENLNLDGLYGLRIAQGQLIYLDQKLKLFDDGDKHFTDKHKIIPSMLAQIERIGNISLATIEHEQTEYYKKFALIASRPFLVDYQRRSINEKLIEKGPRNSQFDEEQSDKCFSLLIGSDSRKCHVDETCWNLMTSLRSDDYRLTHQLLWFLVAKNVGCVSRKGEKRFHLLEDRFCSNIYDEAKSNLMNNHNQDLFLEQILLCSIIGYEEFLRVDWFKTILTWQHPEFDCFSDASETIRFHQKSKRNLLFEQEMKHECLSHKSGLAAGVLATFTRIFFD